MWYEQSFMLACTNSSGPCLSWESSNQIQHIDHSQWWSEVQACGTQRWLKHLWFCNKTCQQEHFQRTYSWQKVFTSWFAFLTLLHQGQPYFYSCQPSLSAHSWKAQKMYHIPALATKTNIIWKTIFVPKMKNCSNRNTNVGSLEDHAELINYPKLCFIEIHIQQTNIWSAPQSLVL
jgi:hypothetical protein